jgi:hypothetical protein
MREREKITDEKDILRQFPAPANESDQLRVQKELSDQARREAQVARSECDVLRKRVEELVNECGRLRAEWERERERGRERERDTTVMNAGRLEDDERLRIAANEKKLMRDLETAKAQVSMCVCVRLCACMYVCATLRLPRRRLVCVCVRACVRVCTYARP